MKGIYNSLARDLNEADRNKVNLLSERERLVKMAEFSQERRGEDRLRMRAEETLNQVNFHRNAVSKEDREMLEGLAEDVKVGADGLATQNRNEVLSLFAESSEALDRQLEAQNERYMANQKLRHHKLLNMQLDEEIDG